MQRKLGEAAKQYINEKFSAARMVEILDKVYSGLLEKKGVSR